MTKIAIVTDSTAYIPEEALKGQPISVIPLQVLWDGKSYRDGVDILPGEFYRRLETSSTMPTTSQATPGQFKEMYSRLLDEGYDVLSVHISGKLSGTLDSAFHAKEGLPGERIELVDSETSGMALGFVALAAARLAEQGATLHECAQYANEIKKHTGIFFVVRTLEYLHRGGRIGGASALLGTMLNLKPILTVVDGKIESADKVRTLSRAIDRMLDLFEKRLSENHRGPIRIACLHANVEQEAQLLLDRARQRFGVSDVAEAFITPVSPVIGTHIGPGGMGIAFMSGY